MRTRNFLGKGRQFRKNRFNGNNFCVCPKCGYYKAHKPGFPCRSEKCPSCNINLIRSKKNFQTNYTNTNTSKSKAMDYPKVDTEICTGCGICIDICPMNAITLLNGKAFIDVNSCSNCRICERECPVEAIK